MGVKHYGRAVRINSDFPSKVDVKLKDHRGEKIEYTLISLPFYLIGQLHRLLERGSHQTSNIAIAPPSKI